MEQYSSQTERLEDNTSKRMNITRPDDAIPKALGEKHRVVKLDERSMKTDAEHAGPTWNQTTAGGDQVSGLGVCDEFIEGDTELARQGHGR